MILSKEKKIVYVKYEGSYDLNLMIKFVVCCEILGLEESFEGYCFGHAFFKDYQYATTQDKVCKNLKDMSITFAQSNLQKCITWPKKFGKGRHEWNQACISFNLHPRNLLKIPIKPRYCFFELSFKVFILLNFLIFFSY